LAVLLLAGCTQTPDEPSAGLSRTVQVSSLDIGVTRLSSSSWGAWLVGPSLITPSRAKVRAAERKAIAGVGLQGHRQRAAGPPDAVDYVELTVAC